MLQPYASTELGPVTVRRKVTARAWSPSRAAPIEATCVLAGQQEAEDVSQPRPFLHEVVPHGFHLPSSLWFRNVPTDQNG